jgi:PAS domain S-box-containing protein
VKRNLIIIGLTVFVIFLVAFLTVRLHGTSEKEVLSQFQAHQLLQAQHVAILIKSYFENRSNGLKALSSYDSLQYGWPQQREKDLRAYLEPLRKIHVKAILLHDQTGRMLESMGDQPVGRDHLPGDLMEWAQRKESKGKVLVFPLPQNPSFHSFQALLTIPLYRGDSRASRSKTIDEFMGVLSLVMNLDEFIKDDVGGGDPKNNQHQLWIMDAGGTPLFQQGSLGDKERPCRNIYQKDDRCNACHASFDYVETILKEKKGVLSYQLKNDPKKLAAFASMGFENASWRVVVTSNYDALGAFERKSLWGHLRLLGVVVLALVGASTLLYRDYRSRLRTQEQANRWREKQQAEEALQKERDKLKGILDSMKDGVYIVNQQCVLDYINPTIEREFGSINGRKCYEYFHDSTGPCPWCKNHEVFGGKAVHAEWYSSRSGKIYDSFSTPFLSEAGTISKLEIFRDITERKQAEEALEKSEEEYHRLVETMNEGLGIHDENSRWTYANDKLCYLLGGFQGDLIGHRVHEFLDEDGQRIWSEQIGRRPKGGIDPYEITWNSRDGRKIPTIISPKPIFDKSEEYKGSIIVITDITDRKQAEEALQESEKQLRFLSAQLLTIQEQERKRISGELHDELGQALAVIKLRINFIKKRLRKDQLVMKEDCEGTLGYIDQVIENVRRLSRDLSPSILEDLGFSAALRWMVNEYMKHHQMKVSTDIEDIDPLLSSKTRIILYRIFQEVLTNIEKHSQATHVSLAIKKEGDEISFSVEDNGKGFDLSEVTARNSSEKGLGLATLKERARMLGGSFNLWSEEGKGTRISFAIPIEKGLE